MPGTKAATPPLQAFLDAFNAHAVDAIMSFFTEDLRRQDQPQGLLLEDRRLTRIAQRRDSRTSRRRGADPYGCAGATVMGALCQEGGASMATVSSQVPDATPQSRTRKRFVVPEMWAALAIGVIWLVVLVDALFGPDIVVSNASGYTRIPSAIVLAFFAWLVTRVIARHGFDRPRDDAG